VSRGQLAAVLAVVALLELRHCAAPALASRDALGQIADELPRIRRALEQSARCR